MTAETILNGAIGVLQRRGRSKGDFEEGDGRVDQLGALAVAAGEDADLWRHLRDAECEDLSPSDWALVDAARFLALVEAPLQPVNELSLTRLVALLGDANDVSTDAEIFDFLTKAAHEAARLAEQAGAAHA